MPCSAHFHHSWCCRLSERAPREARHPQLVKAWKEVDSGKQNARERERQSVARGIRCRRSSPIEGQRFVARARREQRAHPKQVHVVPYRTRKLAQREQVKGREGHHGGRDSCAKAHDGRQR